MRFHPRRIDDNLIKRFGCIQVSVEWDWRRVRKQARFESDMDLAVAVLGALSTQVLRLPVQVDLALIAAILVKRYLLNSWGESRCGRSPDRATVALSGDRPQPPRIIERIRETGAERVLRV